MSIVMSKWIERLDARILTVTRSGLPPFETLGQDFYIDLTRIGGHVKILDPLATGDNLACIQACENGGYYFAGMEYRTNCCKKPQECIKIHMEDRRLTVRSGCADTIYDLAVISPSNGCQSPCTTNSAFGCGNQSPPRISVYQRVPPFTIPGPVDAALLPDGWAYEGCFA